MNIKDLLLRSHEALRDRGPAATVTVTLPYNFDDCKPYGKDTPKYVMLSRGVNHCVVEFRAQNIVDFMEKQRVVIAC